LATNSVVVPDLIHGALAPVGQVLKGYCRFIR
jgi:hypothetical protein